MLRSFFIALSTNRPLRAFSERSSLGRAMSSRFVAGMSVDEALAAAQRLNAEGIAVSLDSLGESVSTRAAAEKSAEIYYQLLEAIETRKLNANVSLKLTQMGMDFDPALAEEITAGIVARAAMAQSFVRIDMEGSGLTDSTLAMTTRLFHRFPGRVGTVLQAYLFRTESDAEKLVAEGIRIRLCKGAYKEPPEIAFPLKADVDANYVKLMKRLVTSPVFCGIATHDEAIIDQLREFVTANGVPKSAFEFQMLYGIRRDLQRKLIQEGYGVRVYVPPPPPSAPSGTPTSCAASPNAQPTSFSWPKTSSSASPVTDQVLKGRGFSPRGRVRLLSTFTTLWPANGPRFTSKLRCLKSQVNAEETGTNPKKHPKLR